MQARPLPDRFETDHHEAEVFDRDVVELRHILERIDGLTAEARRRLRLLEDHRAGIDPRWAADHR